MVITVEAAIGGVAAVVVAAMGEVATVSESDGG